jgi:chromosome segregation ATPase
MDKDDIGEPKAYLLTEAASLTGLSVDALRKRILRRKLRANKSNEDGLWRVWLTSADIEAARNGQLAGLEVDSPTDESGTISALEAQVDTLQRALARERQRADQAEMQVAVQRERADSAEREREEARIRAAAAEAEDKGLREALAEARRPFWRRWINGELHPVSLDSHLSDRRPA